MPGEINNETNNAKLVQSFQAGLVTKREQLGEYTFTPGWPLHPLVIPKNYNLFNELFHLPDLSGYPERFPHSAIADNIPDSSLAFVGLSKVTTLAMLQSVNVDVSLI